MKKNLLYIGITLAALCLCACNTNEPTDSSSGIKNGALTNAAFQVNNAGKKVRFSQGNLQYQASTKTWRFAENQYDMIGEDNKNISDTYDGWIDLFGWGTGSNPTLSSTSYSDYSTFTDWGANNISNGGNKTNQWRTLTKDEWDYVTTKGSKLHKWSNIGGINGYMLLPLNFKTPSGIDLTFNTFPITDWQKLQANGAVFLPAAGDRDGMGAGSVGSVGRYGYYWSSTPTDEGAWLFSLDSDKGSMNSFYRNYGLPVRLVQDIE